MRKHLDRSSWGSLFASKRIVVALCAAIAMVLGAMSVGADTQKPADAAGDYPLPAANQSTLVSEDVGERQQPSQQLDGSFITRRQPTPLTPKQQTGEQSGESNGPLQGLNLSVDLGSVEVETNIVISPQVPLLGNETVVVPAIPSEPAAPPAEDQQLQGDTPTPAAEGGLTTFVTTENTSGTVIQ
jgi:hypothetical protein